jgi:cyclopropane fatty-acyl-phospholipid synthase-like methyltransferase
MHQLENGFDRIEYPDAPGGTAHSAEIQLLRRWRPELFAGGTVLDIGSGLGGFVEALLTAGADATGLEPSPAADQAAAQARPVRRGAFDRLHLPRDILTRKYDLITFRESLYYIPDLSDTFRLLKDMLKERGNVYIKCHTAESAYYARCNNYTSRYGRTVQGMPTLRALRTILKKEGFVITHWRNIEFRYLSVFGIPPYSIWEKAAHKLSCALLHRVPNIRADRIIVLAKRMTR